MQIAVDFCQPFTLDHSNIRGRFTRLGPTVQTIIGQHSYPPLANHLLGEIIGLAVLLSSSLKYEGLFTLQTSSDGPISMLVVDVDSAGNVRACLRVDEDRLKAMIAEEEGGEEALRGRGRAAHGVDEREAVLAEARVVELADALEEEEERDQVELEAHRPLGLQLEPLVRREDRAPHRHARPARPVGVRRLRVVGAALRLLPVDEEDVVLGLRADDPRDVDALGAEDAAQRGAEGVEEPLRLEPVGHQHVDLVLPLVQDVEPAGDAEEEEEEDVGEDAAELRDGGWGR